MQSIDHMFRDWVGKQPADAEYDYRAVCGCAFATFLKDTGICADPIVGGFQWVDRKHFDDGAHPLRDELRLALRTHPRTYGALAARLQAA